MKFRPTRPTGGAPTLSPRSVDSFGIKRAIYEFVEASLTDATGLVVDVGCGHQPYEALVLASENRRYVGVDFPTSKYGTPDIGWDGVELPLADRCADVVLLTEVLEHTAHPLELLLEARRVLQPGGRVLITTPFAWPLHDMPHDQFRYTPVSLSRLVCDAGLSMERLESHGGYDATVVQVLALWARRRPMPRLLRALAMLLVLPLVHLVSRAPDRRALGDQSFPTGFRVEARRPLE